MTRSRRLRLLALSALLIVGACGLFSIRTRRIVSAAEREAAVFHQRLAAGRYDAIYDTAAPAFRGALTRTASAAFFANISAKMGACKIPGVASSYLTHTGMSGIRVQLRYRLECANGILEETMLYVSTGLAGYNATSPTVKL